MITKGIRISQLVERKDLNGKEIIPFQDGIHNGKLSIQSLIDYIMDISDSDLELQALIRIQKFVDTVSEMDLLLYQAKEGDIYYCKENKKLYVRSFNKWDMLDPLTSKVYVLVGLDEYNYTNIIHLWDGNDMVVMSERLFIGEVTGTAYDGGKGKHLADIANSLPDNVIREVADFTTDGSTVTFNYEYDVKQESGLFDGDAQGSKTIPSATTSNAGVMSATDKTKLDGLKDQAGITADIDAVQSNLETHINNKSNPHEVTKAQVGLSEVDNTSDANKPISTATQNALNDKFSATEGNNLKQIVIDMPDLVVTDGSLRHNSDSISLNLIKQNLKNPDDTGLSLLKFDPVTDSTAGIVLPSDKNKIDKIITNGDGTKFLTDDGQYKVIQGSNEYVDNAISSARSYGYMMQLTEIDASGLDENTWYPVTIAAVERMNIRVEVLVSLDSGTKPSWSTHERGFSTRKIWEFAPCAWGVNKNSNTTIYLSDFNWADIDPVRGLANLSHSVTCYVFVRGGGKYYFYVSHSANVILHTDTYTLGDQSVSPTTTTPKPINALDLKNYGKVIDVPDGSYLTLNVNRVGTDAIDYINNVFGSKDRLKEVIMDIIENHQRYLFHSYVSNLNCVEPNNVYAYYNDAKNEYNLQYNLSYYTTNGPVSKRAAFLVTPYNEGYKVEVTDLATSWNNLPDVLTELNEFNIADNNITSSYFWINYRPRSGSTTNAKNIYVGNGQGNGGFGEVHASGFFKVSDIRLKSNIVPLNHTLEQICNIPTVSFDIRNKHQIGTIAQDIENDFADIVDTDSNGMKSVDYCMLGVVAVEGIKLLKQEIEDLKKQVEELKNGR